MSETEIQDEIINYSNGVALVEMELEWILDVVNDNKPKPNDPLAEEMIGKFYSLYSDFIRLRYDSIKLMQRLLLMEDARLSSSDAKQTYINALEKILQKSSEGKFAKFISVAETGKLPVKD
jgi:hypothetical protein